jgi:endoribonuclease Dicer
MKKKNFYHMRVKPSVWEYGRGDLPAALYLTILDVTNGLERPYQPMGLLTRVPLLQMPRFPVYLREGKVTEVKSMSFGSGFDVSGDMIEHLTTLTLRAYKDIFAKTYEHDPTKMSYWFAPLRDPKTVVMEGYESPADFINWSVVQDVFETEEYKWTPDMKHEYLRYRFLVDKWDGGRRFFSVEVAPDMKAMDPLPAHSEKHKKFNDSILDYSVSLWNKSRKNYSWDLSQPVVEAERVPFRRNLLAPAEEKERDGKIRCFVCPEPLRISAVSQL